MDYDVLQKDLCLLGNSFVAESITSFKDKLAFASQADDIYLFQADCLDLLDKIAAKYPNGCFDMIFADPPYFHASETLIWAAKNSQSRHVFNYEAMKEMNNHKQMQSVWNFSPPHISEKQFGKHPTQKPVSLVERCILAATDKGAFIFDPFAGSSTTGVAAIQTKRGFCGVELESEFIQLSTKRLQLALNKRSRI